MIADHADDVAVQFAETMTAEQVHHAMWQPRHHDHDGIPFRSVEEIPLEALPREQRRHRRTEVFGELADWLGETLEVDSPEEVSVFVVGVLVGRDNIAPERK